MANELAKYLNSRRRLKDENAVKKQTKIAKQKNSIGAYQSKAEKQPHRFSKHHAMDCGNPKCFLCGNPRKTHKDKLTPQEKRLFQDLDNTSDRHSNGVKPDEEDLL